MSGWTEDELRRLSTEDEIRLASVRRDGSLRRPVVMWMVTDGSDVYVRAVKGVDGPWYRSLRTTDAAHVTTGGLEADVTAEDAGAEPALADRLDDAYRRRYEQYPPAPVRAVLTDLARESTLRLTRR